MVKQILCSLTALFLVACTQVNSSGNKTITEGGDTVSDVEISLSKMDMVDELSKIEEPEASKLLFKASGTEPGWFAELYNQKIRLVVDYGKDSLLLEHKFESLEKPEGCVVNINDTDANKNVKIQIINKPCTDAGSGDKMDRTILVTFKGKNYKGCGSFVK